MFDVACIGNALIDAFLTIHEANNYCSLDADGKLSLQAGEKINLEKSEFLIGGNAANVAVGLRRLGRASSLVAEIGSDEFSHKIATGLAKEQVDTSYLQQTEAASSFAIGLNFKNERTLFVQHVERKHEFPLENVQSRWVYLTSLGEKWQPAYKKTADMIRSTGTLLAFNPGSLQLAEGVASFSYLLPLITLLFVNKQEAQLISGEKTDNIQLLLQKTQAQGPKTVVMTDGENGSYVITADGDMYQGGLYPVKDVERTGAGDAYASGFLAAVLHGEVATEAMRWGAANSASVISKTGAQTGLLIRSEMEKHLVSHEVQIKEMSL